MNDALKKIMKDLQTEEAKLLAKKEAAKRSAIDEINEVIALFNIKQSDLDFSGKAPVKEKKAPGRRVKRTRSDAGKKVEPKYIAPDGTTWTGRGRMPKAIEAAVAEGYSLEDLLIVKKDPAAVDPT